MFNLHRKEITWGGRQLVLETGKLARQADGAVVVSYGETIVLCTVVAEKHPKPDMSFFPLTVHYQEKSYAAGKIPGGFFKREGKPSEKEVLVSRLIDRPIRPLFPENFHHDTQVICTVLSHDLENDPDIVALIGASAALAISGVPFAGPLGAARIGYNEGQYLLNPSVEDLKTSQLDLVVAGTTEGVLMVESQAQELSEEQMLGAVIFGHAQFQPIIELIKSLAKEAGKPTWAVPQAAPEEATIMLKLHDKAEADVRTAYNQLIKQDRVEQLSGIKARVIQELVDEGFSETLIKVKFKKLEKDIVRGDILKSGHRIDGRDTKTIRPIQCEVGLLSRTHGSAVFTRGETQALVITTLGTGQDEQILDLLEGESRENFMLHYNFPPFSVGETGRMSGPGRREIGHGKLAWRALRPLLPTKEEFPYTIRLVSEITESNGSSSMATVCGASLSLMDAGVPLPRPVAGIAMGLIKEDKSFAVLSDILGDEDYLGDMDFKVAGTSEGITALQMDIKVTSITQEIMDQALNQAKEGRLHILGEMHKALDTSRGGISENAPQMSSITVKKEKIGEIIGPGGKMIRQICEETGVKIDIDDTGKVNISAVDKKSVQAAIDRILSIVVEPEIGNVYHGKVAKIVEFGAFVDFLGSRGGLVHISELANERVARVEDVIKEGQEVYVQVKGFEARGKIRLSMKSVDQTTGQPIGNASSETRSEEA
jgi:polyribonucleotide nucleotidyltransferase